MHPHSRKRQDFSDAKSQGAVVQLVRMPACHAGGRGFESLPHRLQKASQNFERLFCIHSLHSFSSLILFTHSLHSFSSLILFAHSLHSFSSLTIFTHYLHSLSSLILFTYSLHPNRFSVDKLETLPFCPPRPHFGGQVGKSAVLSTQTAFWWTNSIPPSIIQSMNMLNCFHSFPRLFRLRRIHVFSAFGCLSCCMCSENSTSSCPSQGLSLCFSLKHFVVDSLGTIGESKVR